MKVKHLFVICYIVPIIFFYAFFKIEKINYDLSSKIGYYIKSGIVLECPEGTYCPIANLTSPILCPIGHFCPKSGMIYPYYCPYTFYCPKLGMTYPNDCQK